jgi:hypothetical protein
LVKGALYPLALIGMGVFQAMEDLPGAWEFVPLWTALGLAGLIAAGFFFGNMQPPHIEAGTGAGTKPWANAT